MVYYENFCTIKQKKLIIYNDDENRMGSLLNICGDKWQEEFLKVWFLTACSQVNVSLDDTITNNEHASWTWTTRT